MDNVILGIKPDYTGLMIDPHLPKEIKNAKVTRIFRGVKYNININNTSSGKYQMVVDGKEIDGNIIPFNKDKAEVNVNIYL